MHTTSLLFKLPALLTLEARLVHERHSRAVVLAGETLYVSLHRYGPHGWFEVEEADLSFANKHTHIQHICANVKMHDET